MDGARFTDKRLGEEEERDMVIPHFSFTDGAPSERKMRIVEVTFLEGDNDCMWIAVYSAKIPTQRVMWTEGETDFEFHELVTL